MKTFVMCAAALCVASGAMAGLIDTRTGPGGGTHTQNGVLDANEFGAGNSQSYTGSGTGFGGTLGNGRIYMDSDATNLYIGVQVGGNLNDNIVMYMNTGNTGGFNSSTQMDDNSDPGRGRSSDMMSNGTASWAINAQYSFVVGSFGAVLFGLNGNGNAHTFLMYDGTYTGNGNGFREYSISLASINALSSRNYIDWFSIYTSDSGFMSNESISVQGFNAGGNLGFDNGGNALVIENYNRYQVPTPGALALAGLGGLMAGRRRR
jgi:hypothetical protein